MKIFLLSFLIYQISFANQVNKAFKDFFNNEVISSRHCGKNIFHFLNYLKERNIKYSSAHVVSLHEPSLLGVRSFDARWGNKEKYKNGETFSFSNWYFHVFAVIDGVAYDFSQSGVKTQSVKKYLKTTYVPKSTTERIIMIGEYTKEKAFKDFRNLDMRIYRAEDYAKNYGPILYQGTFLEYFNFNDDIAPHYSNYQASGKDYELTFSKAYTNRDNSVTILEPRLKIQSHVYPLIAMPLEICRAYGYLGSISSEMTYTVSDDVTALKLSSSLGNSEGRRQISTNDISIGWRTAQTMGSVENQPLFHYASSVTCSDLHSVLLSL